MPTDPVNEGVDPAKGPTAGGVLSEVEDGVPSGEVKVASGKDESELMMRRQLLL